MKVIKNFRNYKLEKLFFYLIIFLFPVNLGYHFVLSSSYINGILIDYLIPVVYLQDILIIIFLLIYWKKIDISYLYGQKFFVWFIAVLFFSLSGSDYKQVGLVSVLRVVLYFLFMLYTKSNINLSKDKQVVNVIFTSIFFLCVLSIFQWVKQGAVFNNYLYFGEQPYNAGTVGVNIENFFGVSKVPPYGTFRHPNVLGGILSIILVWLAFYLKKGNLFYKLCFIFCFITLFLSLSLFAWMSALLGIALLISSRNFAIKTSAIIAVFIFWACCLFLPYMRGLDFLDYHPSFYRRSNLLVSSYAIVKNNFWFGVGPSAITSQIDKYFPPSREIRFTQPVHNIFVLIFAEIGVFGYFLFIAFFFSNLASFEKNKLVFISLLQILFLSSVDHYFWTMHQSLFFFFLLLGFK